MSSDIASLLQRLNQIEEARLTPTSPHGSQNPQQKGVPQLPALFKVKTSRVLGGKEKPHPTSRYMVGDDVAMDVAQTPLEEAIKDVEEGMIEKVRQDLTTYLDDLAQEYNAEKKIKSKAKKDVGDENPAKPGQQSAHEEIDEDPTEQEPSVEVPHVDYKPEPVVNPGLPEEAPIKRVAIDENNHCEIYGDERRGFEVGRGPRRLKTKFRNIDDAETAIELWKGRRFKQNQDNSDQDYLEEK